MTPQTIPSSLTTRYHHAGCCQEYAGVLVEVHTAVEIHTGAYVPPPAPRCAISHAELRQDNAVPLATYPRR